MLINMNPNARGTQEEWDAQHAEIRSIESARLLKALAFGDTPEEPDCIFNDTLVIDAMNDFIRARAKLRTDLDRSAVMQNMNAALAILCERIDDRINDYLEVAE